MGEMFGFIQSLIYLHPFVSLSPQFFICSSSTQYPKMYFRRKNSGDICPHSPLTLHYTCGHIDKDMKICAGKSAITYFTPRTKY
jgi:hypothetical protein